jgi:SulP family sulfate permease
MDASAACSFARVRQLATAHHVVLVCTHLTVALQHQLEKSGGTPLPDASCRLFATLDYGVEWCENHLLADAGVALSPPQPLSRQLTELLQAPVDTARLRQYFAPHHLPAGAVLIGQGDPADALYWIEQGQVSAVLELADGQRLRLRTTGAGTLMGELGVYLGMPRTASVITEQPTMYLRLTREALHEMRRHDPALAAALDALVIRLLAERLASLNTTVEALLQ